MNENEKERSRRRALAERLKAEVMEMAEELTGRNVDVIAQELITSQEATGGFAIKFDVAIIGEKVSVESKISWSRKFSDGEEGGFSLPDPNAPALPGMVVGFGGTGRR